MGRPLCAAPREPGAASPRSSLLRGLRGRAPTSSGDGPESGAASPGPRPRAETVQPRGHQKTEDGVEHRSPPTPGRPGAAHLRGARDRPDSGRGEVRNRNCAPSGRGALLLPTPSAEKKCIKQDPSLGTSFCTPSCKTMALASWMTKLASIADEMELRLLLPQFVEPIRMTVYSHIGLRDVLRSFMVAFTNLRENRSLWSFLTLRDRVSLDSMTLTYIPASGASCRAAAPQGIPSLDATVRTTPYYPVLPASPVSTAAWSQRPLGLRLWLVDQMHESLPASTPEPCFSLCQESPPCGRLVAHSGSLSEQLP
ncbi:translocator protein isoform X2 [Delphinapterus leucas]|uniref:Translocator protein isoform X2 n=1 Tax=Delphinapterus leucas TaxID=9749 RepID=A0A2Y9PZC3_DELLE|nr:translocator protein isoform X2 [Delphinapterus leucas]